MKGQDGRRRMKGKERKRRKRKGNKE